MRPTTRRILTATISAALLVTACSSGDDEAAPTTTESAPTTAPETTAASTTTTAPTTTSTDAPTTTASPTTTEPPPTTTDPPPTTNPGDPDWLTITQGLLETLHDINENPDVARIEEFCLAGENNCHDVQGKEIRTFVENGWRVVGVPVPVLIRAEVVGTAEDAPIDSAVWVLVQVERAAEDLSAAKIVDSEGDLVFNIVGPDPPTSELLDMYLIDTPQGWRVLSITSSE